MKNYYFLSLVFLGLTGFGASYAVLESNKSASNLSGGLKQAFSEKSTYVIPLLSVGYYINQNWNSIYNNGNGIKCNALGFSFLQGLVNATVIGGTIGTIIREALDNKKFQKLHSSFKFILDHPYITSFGVGTIFTLAKNYYQDGHMISSVQDKHMIVGLGLCSAIHLVPCIWNKMPLFPASGSKKV